MRDASRGGSGNGAATGSATDGGGRAASSAPQPATHPTAHPIHASLTRSRLYLGVERTVIAIEGTLCAALLFGVGLSLATVGLIALVMLVVHPVMVWATARDAQATEVFLRARAYADFYATHAGLGKPGRKPRASVPPGR